MRLQASLLFLVSLGALTGLFSCNDKICPSYSSYFILDNSNANKIQLAYGGKDYPDLSYYLYENPIRDQYFAYLTGDSIPRTNMTDVSKNRFGIIDRKGYRQKEYEMQTIPMEVVIPEPDDSLKFAGDEELIAELDVVDSTAIDSLVAMRTYKYNNDQKYYLWYLRNKLIWKDEIDGDEEEEGEETAEGVEEGEVVEEKQPFFKRISDWFSNLFKKKDKEADPAVDESPTEDPPAQEEEDGF